MLYSKLTNSPQCAEIPALIKNIDCALNKLSIELYNNTIFMFNKQISSYSIFALLEYKKILTMKYCDPEYLSCFTIPMIASKIKKLSINCKCKCVNNGVIITTTTTTTLPVTTTTTTTTGLTMFSISTLSVECCDPPGYGFQTIDSVAYHSGINALPEIGDYVYTDSLGTIPISGTGPAAGYTMTGPSWLEIGNFGIVTNTTCVGCR